MNTNYYLDLFTGKTWEEFLKRGGKVTGFKERRSEFAKKIKPGDYFLCYLTGISRFVAALEVQSECYVGEDRIWEDQVFPIRFDVKLVHQLTPETAVPVIDLKDNFSIFNNLKSKNAWTGFFRGSPAAFRSDDGKFIFEAIEEATQNPVKREYDEKKYYRRPRTFESQKVGTVTVPEPETDSEDFSPTPDDKITHEEIQYLLLRLGSDMGLDVWVAKNDRNKNYGGNNYQDIPRLKSTLPIQFDDATNKTIELIDVLWLQGDAIMAAFEVEHTSAIYSGLLRMSDLISMQPNIKINLFIVAPDERQDKVISEVNRPTFSKLKPPLHKVCRYIPYSRLKGELDQIGYRITYLKPEFLNEIAEDCSAVINTFLLKNWRYGKCQKIITWQ